MNHHPWCSRWSGKAEDCYICQRLYKEFPDAEQDIPIPQEKEYIVEETMNKRAKILAVDFDGTLCEHDYPEIGAPTPILSYVKRKKKEGWKIILWTCRGGEDLQEAIYWCKNVWGLEFDAINEDLPEIKEGSFGKTKSCKIFADLYLDDRNLSIKEALAENNKENR